MPAFRSRAFPAALAALLLAAPGAAAGPHGPVVVELYTSQGCSRCPPADAFLAELAERDDVIATSLPITYWDIYGWKDTLANEANTERQKSYARIMGRRGVYTPQMIIDGTTDLVGSRRDEVLAEIAARRSDTERVRVELSATQREVRIFIGDAPKISTYDEATIWIAPMVSEATVVIERGENAGLKLRYVNVVRDIKAVGIWRGEAMTVELPRDQLSTLPHDRILVIVQNRGHGRILGAALATAPDYFVAR